MAESRRNKPTKKKTSAPAPVVPVADQPAQHEFQLEYYDFIIIGHSGAGKSTYLTMLCEEGGDRNPQWAFKAGGAPQDVSASRPRRLELDKGEGKSRFAKAVEQISRVTERRIRGLASKIRDQDGEYSTAAIEEMVFSFKPPGAKLRETILTLDWPGEWLSKRSAWLDEFGKRLSRAQALVIMLDPFQYTLQEGQSYVEGLEAAQRKFRSGDRGKQFAPRKSLPVAVIINKAELLSEYRRQETKLTPEQWLQENCGHLCDGLDQLTNNWRAFFVSCWGTEEIAKKLELGKKTTKAEGAYTPPAKPKPVGLVEPLQWILAEGRKRVRRSLLGKLGLVAATLFAIYGSLFAWDWSAFSDLAAREPAFTDRPADLYREYTRYSKHHFAARITGFAAKAEAKRKQSIRLYLKLEVRAPDSMSVDDFIGVIAQVEEWCLDIGDRSFSERVQSEIEADVNPLFERRYCEILRAESDLPAFETGLTEYETTFGDTACRHQLVEKLAYSRIYRQVREAESTGPEGFASLTRQLAEYVTTYKPPDPRYAESVNRLHEFTTALTGGGNAKRYSVTYLGYEISDALLGTHKEMQEVCRDETYRTTCAVDTGWTTRQEPCDKTRRACADQEVDVPNPPKVTVRVIVGGAESLATSVVEAKQARAKKRFSFDWAPGQDIEVSVENLTGKAARTTRRGVLAINALRGVLSVGGQSQVGFDGEDLSLPVMVVP